MTNRELRKALLEKLGISRQALWQRAQKLIAQCPMSTEEATYVIAQQAGINISRHLDKNTVDRVRELLKHVSPATQTAPLQSRQAGRIKGASRERQTVIVIGKEFKGSDPVLPLRKLSQAKDMAAVYPYLYVLENSIREVIDRVMTSKYGGDWWDSQAPKGLREKVSKRMADEKKNSWHQRRGNRPIDYLDLEQLPAVMRKIQNEVVPDIIPSIEWFIQMVEEVYKSRCVVCHMNPLDRTNIQAVKLRLTQWQNLMKAKRNLIYAD